MLSARMTASAHSRRPIDPVVEAALLAMCAFWAANVVVLKVLLKDIPPAALSAGRYVIVSAVAVVVATARGGSWTIEGRDVPRALASGMLGVALFQVLFMEGLQRTSAFTSNLIQGTEPLFALLFLRILARARIGPRQWWGVLVALLGAVLFFIEGSTGDTHLAFGLGELLSLSGAFVFALYGLVSGPLFARYPGHLVMAITMFAGTLPLVAWAWPGLHAVDWNGLRPTVWAGLVFSSVVPLYLGFWIWNWAVAKKGLDHVSLYIFVDIVLSGFFAYALLGERFGPLRLLGAAVIMSGVYLARSGEV
jgi:drug/metabolite transporter (DMT)-like permease